MKKFILIIVLILLSFSVKAQLVLTNQGNGIVDVMYGDADYSLFDPVGSTEVYLYLWVDIAQTNPAISQQYNDDWNDANSLIILNWDSNVNKFTGSINFNTHDFIGEGVLPSNTTLNDFNLVLRDQVGNSATQSVDLVASDYSFVATTTAKVNQFEITNNNIKLYPTITTNSFKVNERTNFIEIFTVSGKNVKTFKGDFTNGYCFNINDLSPALYFVKIETLKGRNIQKLIVK